MATIATPGAIQHHNANIDDVKTKVVVEQVEVEVSPTPPVADNFMYDFKYNHTLPTTDVLGVEIPSDCDTLKAAEGIVGSLSRTMGEGDAQAFTDLFLEYGEFQLELSVYDVKS